MEAYLESNCARYVSPKGLNNLIALNRKSITEIERGLSSQDKAVLKRLANDLNEQARIARLIATYITDTVASNTNEPGGAPFACGVAHGNVTNVFIQARRDASAALEVNR